MTKQHLHKSDVHSTQATRLTKKEVKKPCSRTVGGVNDLFEVASKVYVGRKPSESDSISASNRPSIRSLQHQKRRKRRRRTTSAVSGHDGETGFANIESGGGGGGEGGGGSSNGGGGSSNGGGGEGGNGGGGGVDNHSGDVNCNTGATEGAEVYSYQNN